MKKNTARNISLAINVAAIITIAVLMCLNQAAENKLKAEIDSEKSISYTAGYVAAIADSTPVKIDVSNSGAQILFANGEGYYLDGNSVENSAVKTVVNTTEIKVPEGHEHCIREEDIVYMSKDKYDYYELEIGDVNTAKYDRMAKRIGFTKADMEREIQEYKK